jgi:CRP-like cAMP-binding protein
MISIKIAEIIKKTPLFQNISQTDVEELATYCHQKSVSKGQELFSMGDKADSLYIVLKGWIKLYRTSKEGEETIINIFGPGESFAEAAVFNDSHTYPVNAQAVEDSMLIDIPYSYFVRKIEDDKNFALRILGAIASRQHYLVQQLEQVTTRSATQRIGAFLLRFCIKESQSKNGTWVVDLPYDKSVISTRLNIKPETFSRAIAKLEPYGVSINKRQIIIADKNELMDYCDVPTHEKPC